jgi:adenylylsulfate kinase-like enzyme
MPARFPLLWLTGNSGAGKTTLATNLERWINEELAADHPLARRCIVLDGDDMRATISTDETLTAEDRRRHNLRVARLAAHLRDRGFLVVVAVIAPFASVRRELDALCGPQWIFVKRGNLGASDRPYEEPDAPHCVIDHDRLGIDEAFMALKGYVEGICGEVTSLES